MEHMGVTLFYFFAFGPRSKRMAENKKMLLCVLVFFYFKDEKIDGSCKMLFNQLTYTSFTNFHSWHICYK